MAIRFINMKKRIFYAFTFLILTFVFGCKKDKLGDIRDGYIANYSVTEKWTEKGKTLTKAGFTMSVEKSTRFINMILLNNFGNYGAGVTAEALVNGNIITITQQTLPNLKAISGTGTLTDSSLNFVYTETYLTTVIDVTTIAKKK